MIFIANMIIDIVKRYSRNLFTAWISEEQQNFLSLLKENKGCSFVDLSSGSGELTVRFAKKCKAKEVVAIDSASMKKENKSRNISFLAANLNKKLPLPSNHFDVVISHFSLEHLYNTGFFIKETKRIFKKGGYTIVATDNQSNWSNVFSLIMGWQPSVSAYGVANKILGNPFALKGDFHVENESELGELSQNKVLSYKMLLDAYREYGYEIEKTIGIGYFPFYGFLSRFFWLDIRHAHWLIHRARKK